MLSIFIILIISIFLRYTYETFNNSFGGLISNRVSEKLSEFNVATFIFPSLEKYKLYSLLLNELNSNNLKINSSINQIKNQSHTITTPSISLDTQYIPVIESYVSQNDVKSILNTYKNEVNRVNMINELINIKNMVIYSNGVIYVATFKGGIFEYTNQYTSNGSITVANNVNSNNLFNTCENIKTYLKMDSVDYCIATNTPLSINILNTTIQNAIKTFKIPNNIYILNMENVN